MASSDFLSLQLKRLDLLLHREILRMRAAYQLSLDEFRGLYISDEQVDGLIDAERLAQGLPEDAVAELGRQAEALRIQSLALLSASAPWLRHLSSEFNLSLDEQDLVLLALAPEIDLKYEALYAYINNDISRKYPSIELALRVFSASSADRTGLRRLLLPEAALFAENLLLPLDNPASMSSLSRGFMLNPLLSRYLQGLGCGVPAPLSLIHRQTQSHSPNNSAELTCQAQQGWDGLPLTEAELFRLKQTAKLFTINDSLRPAPCLIFEGRPGAGRSKAAAALCAELGLDLLSLDLQAARANPEALPKLIDQAMLQSRLLPAGLYLSGLEAMFNAEGKPLPDCQILAAALIRCRAPLFLSCAPGSHWQECLGHRPALAFHFPEPEYALRIQLWRNALTSRNMPLPEQHLAALAGRFVLNAAQIGAAVNSANYSRLLSADKQSDDVADLFQAAREQSDASLGSLAVKIATKHSFTELVLPAAILARLKNLTAAIHNRHIVYADWGFAKRITTGKGVKALFAGGSGTGKTMAAGVIARELHLDLYKIDLSGIVSKYIGETEKNLDRIFRAAHASNAILFFDEADALFGKRSEVKDAHDRYANIEVAYLLQKVEEHEGVVILASNLGKNIDAAFSRRLHYVIEFPQPDEQHRERLWCSMFPPEAPLGEDVDFRFLAKQFTLAGGDIKNVALDAAFLAAQDGRIVTMKQLINAMARQMAKQGRMPSAADFKQYHDLIGYGG